MRIRKLAYRLRRITRQEAGSARRYTKKLAAAHLAGLNPPTAETVNT